MEGFYGRGDVYPDLVPDGLPKREEDGDLMRWLNSLCEQKVLWGVFS